jgi:hypothetical protein
MLPSVANVKPGRHVGAAFTTFVDDTFWATRKVEKSGGRCLLSYHSCDEIREGDGGHSHIFPHGSTS